VPFDSAHSSAAEQPALTANGLSPDDLLKMYRWMLLTREFEDRICGLWGKPGVVELPHGSQGQEAIAVGACFGLRSDDYVLPSLRGRGVFLVRGVSARQQMAGVFARVDGAARGRATAHHMGDPARGILLGSAIVGASITLSVGAALGIKLQHRDAVVVEFFGDGAAQRGDFHEALNFAAVFRLPVVFLLENNGFAEYTPLSRHFAGTDFACRAQGYGFPGQQVDGNDILAVYQAVQHAVTRARAGEGPTLLECITFRQRNHCEVETPATYRDAAEVERWHARDPLVQLRTTLVSRGILSDGLVEQVQREVSAHIDDAVRFAEQSPLPDPAECASDVYAPEPAGLVVGRRS
jgi:TPP-dependent pyruvate/acetoin dehydrogenase alpha subunit